MTKEQQELHDMIVTAADAFDKARPLYRADQGWDLFNTDDPLRCGIEKIDESDRFVSDQEALIYVSKLTALGNHHARDALIIHMLANELRGLAWGDAYINSRMGPP